jgi:hypothetical protein
MLLEGFLWFASFALHVLVIFMITARGKDLALFIIKHPKLIFLSHWICQKHKYPFINELGAKGENN